MRIAPAEPPQLGAAAAAAPVPCAGCSAQGSAWGHGSPTLGSFSTEASKSTLFTLRRCFLYEASCLWAETGSSSLDSALLPPRLLLPAVVQSALKAARVPAVPGPTATIPVAAVPAPAAAAILSRFTSWAPVSQSVSASLSTARLQKTHTLSAFVLGRGGHNNKNTLYSPAVALASSLRTRVVCS